MRPAQDAFLLKCLYLAIFPIRQTPQQTLTMDGDQHQSEFPTSQLESLKYKVQQILDSVNVFHQQIDWIYFRPEAMLPWPEILSKFNVLLSQTHSLSTSLVSPINFRAQQQQPGQGPPPNPFTQMVVHPSTFASDQDNARTLTYLRSVPITTVLEAENATVRRIAEHMECRGSIGVLSDAPPPPPAQIRYGAPPPPEKPDYYQVQLECDNIRNAHDQRVERAVRAVAMLREKYSWNSRLEVEVEEPEELDLSRADMDVDIMDGMSDEEDGDLMNDDNNADDH